MPASSEPATPAPALRLRRRHVPVIAAIAAAALVVTVWNARVWLVLGVEGVQAALVMAAACGWGAWPVRWLNLHRRPALQQFCLAAGLGLGILSTLTLCLGAAGGLTRVSAWALLIAGGAAGLLRVWQRTPVRSPSEPQADRAGPPAASLVGRAAALLPLALPLALVLYGASLAPGILWLDENKAYDALEYHLQGPREYYEAGRIHFLPHNVYTSFPQQVETLFLLCMHLAGGVYAGAIPAQFLHAFHGVLAVLALAAWAESRWSRVVVAVVAGTTPWLAHLACLAYVELGVVLFATLAGALLLDTVRRPETLTGIGRPAFSTRTVLAAGLFAGLAGGCKYTALVLVAAALGVAWALTLWWGGRAAGPASGSFLPPAGGAAPNAPLPPREGAGGGSERPRPAPSFPLPPREGAGGGSKRRPDHRSTRSERRRAPAWANAETGRDIRPARRFLLLAVYAAGVLAAFSPWLVRNAALAGNPVYPFAYEWFGGRAWSDEQAEQWARGHEVPEERSGLVGRARSTWDELLAAPKYGPAVFIVAALALIARPDRATGCLVVWLALLVLAWAGLTHMPGRFAVPAVVPLALLIGRLPADLTTALRPGPVRRRLIAAAALPLAFVGGVWNDVTLARLWQGDAAYWGKYGATLGVFVGATELYVRELEPLNRVAPPDATIRLVGEARAFYIDRDVRYTVVFNRDPWLEFAAQATPAQAVDWLRRENVTHVLFSWAEIDRLARSYGFQAFVTREWARRLEAAGLQRVDTDGMDSRHMTLYRVPPA